MSAALTSPGQASKAPRQQLPCGLNHLHLLVTRTYRRIMGHMPTGADVGGNVRPTGTRKSGWASGPPGPADCGPRPAGKATRPCWQPPQAVWGGGQPGHRAGRSAGLKSDKMSLSAASRKCLCSGKTTQARKSRLNEGPNSEARSAPHSQTAGVLRPDQIGAPQDDKHEVRALFPRQAPNQTCEFSLAGIFHHGAGRACSLRASLARASMW
jgi:hypothetical protein